VIEKVQWICEACDSPNSVEASEPAICRYCRLTYEVRIERGQAGPRDPASPAVEAAVELLGLEPERDADSPESKREK
jgi:hypothetical protein